MKFHTMTILHVFLRLTRYTLFITAVSTAQSRSSTLSIIFMSLGTKNKWLFRKPDLLFDTIIAENKESICIFYQEMMKKGHNTIKSAVIATHQVITKYLDPESKILYDYDDIISFSNCQILLTNPDIDLNTINIDDNWLFLTNFSRKYILETEKLMPKSEIEIYVKNKCQTKRKSICTDLIRKVDQIDPALKSQLVNFNTFFYDTVDIYKYKGVILDGLKTNRWIKNITFFFVDLLSESVFDQIFCCLDSKCYDVEIALKSIIIIKYEYEINGQKVVSRSEKLYSKKAANKPVVYSYHIYSIRKESERDFSSFYKLMKDTFKQSFGEKAVKHLIVNIYYMLQIIWSALEDLMLERYKYFTFKDNKLEYEQAQLKCLSIYNQMILPHLSSEIAEEVEAHNEMIKNQNEFIIQKTDTNILPPIAQNKHDQHKNSFVSNVNNIVHGTKRKKINIILTYLSTRRLF